jgi:hypothetical protein
MALTTAQKAAELLDDLSVDNAAPEEKWIKLAAFDPMHGRSELTYAEKMGWIERKPGQVRLTEAGRLAWTKKKFR